LIEEAELKTVVCKIGGSIIEGVDPSIVEDIKSFKAQGVRTVLVHGGGDQVTEYAEKLGKKQRFITSPAGIKSRYTDRETAEIFTMVMNGLLSKKIVQTLLVNGINAMSLSGLDGSLLMAERKKRLVIIDERGKKVAIEGGYTGKITAVNTMLLSNLFNLSIVPVISPVAAENGSWNLLNIDGDRACSHIAGALKADASIFLTDMEGLILDGSLAKDLTTERAKKALSSIGPGMDKKVIAAVEAVEMGCRKSIISSGLKKNPIQKALNNEGTVITSTEKMDYAVELQS
jgi:[amino group carrier protein]-L-2-aminoadipate 6-kinase